MEKVITIALQTTHDAVRFVHNSMDELRQLVETAGGQVVESQVQKKGRPDPATFIGKGKAAELAERAGELGVKAVVFDEELRPVQQRNLEDVIGTKVIDRTRLILDIFARRARTREGILQVELAQLNYLLPRLTDRFGRFEQQVGGIGTRGPGERKLEVDRRRIRVRIAALSQQIEAIRLERSVQRRVRRSVPVPQVALVGYTNTGKSTLLNALLRLAAGAPKAHAHAVYADDKLFATLDPTTRRVRLPSGRAILFSDTVGFIRKLPTELVAAFRATLEEVATADLLLQVVDASDATWKQQAEVVADILHRLKIDRLPRITAYNKMDKVSRSQREAFQHAEGFPISARTGEGLRDLLSAVEETLSTQWVEKDLLLPYSEGARLAQLHEHMEILSQETSAEGIRLRVRTHPATLAQWLSDKSDSR
jgi:GTP-binding protein HflX